MKGIIYIIKWATIILSGFILLVFISLLIYKKHLKTSTKIDSANGISSLEKIKLGGLNQWIFIRGENKSNPVLIFLHGGPGVPLMGMASSRKLDADLIKHFTVVHWDQRGAGKSYNNNIPKDSMTIDRFVEDCNELIDYVRNRFNIQKVFIVGHSWGSVIGIKTVYKYPEKIHAYVGMGQIISDYEQQKISYNFVVEKAEKSGDLKIKNAIKALGPPPYDTPKKISEKDKYIFQYGGIALGGVKQIIFLMSSFLTSPEYSILEGFRSFGTKGYNFCMSLMWEEIKNINLIKEIQSIKVPLYFFEGKYDMATPTVIVENVYDNLDLDTKKGKKLIVFENSAHFPMIEKEKYEDLLINLVLRESQNK
jgi:pimeloyl-ACP methyl ester carboxylesterase